MPHDQILDIRLISVGNALNNNTSRSTKNNIIILTDVLVHKESLPLASLSLSSHPCYFG